MCIPTGSEQLSSKCLVVDNKYVEDIEKKHEINEKIVLAIAQTL